MISLARILGGQCPPISESGGASAPPAPLFRRLCVVRIDCRALKDGGDYHAAVDVQAYTAL